MIRKVFLNNNQSEFEVDLTVNLLSSTHQYFKQQEDVSAVSLRDIKRFLMIFRWFKDLHVIFFELGIPHYQHPSAEIILSFLCNYYFRLCENQLRKDFLFNLESIFDEFNISIEEVLELLNVEMMIYISEIGDKIPQNVAINKALKENVFLMITCFMTKVPLFICGKPGSSKTLSLNLVLSSLTGTSSQSILFSRLPELQKIFFQCSEYCTSEGFENTFKKAKKFSQMKEFKHDIVVLVFEEIGLAELAPGNPLKVLHAALEIEENNFGFIGISNWKVDASKMNRTLFLGRTDPDKEDLIEIVKSITRGDLKLANQ